MDGDDDIQQVGGSSREYDFSDDFNISEVKDVDQKSEPTPLSANGALPKSLSEAVDKSLSQITKPGVGSGPQTAAPIQPPVRKPGASLNMLEEQAAIPVPPREPMPDPKPAAAPVPPPTQRPDPFREPITKLDTEWPFATPETIARHRDREKEPFAMPQKQAAVPTDLPTGMPSAPIAPAVPPMKPAAPAAPVRPIAPVRPATPVAPTVPPAMPKPFMPVPPRPPQAPVSVQPPQEPAKNPAQPQQHPGGLKNIRTYESDVAEALASRPLTKTSIALAESKKRGEGEVLTNGKPVVMPTARPMNIPSRVVQQPGITVELGEKSRIGWKLVIIILSLMLLGGGVFGGYYLYSQSPLAAVQQAPQTQEPQHTPALVPYDTQAVINIDGLNNIDIMKRINSELDKNMASSSIKEIVLTETKDAATYRVSAPEAALVSGVPVPDIIARTLAPEWMLGVYANESAERTPFVVVHTNLFQNAFAGMLAWEPSMIRDLQPFLGISSGKPIPAGSFKDQIVKNKDVRAFVTTATSTVFEYSFIDNQTLVVTGNNSALSAIISRLDSKAFVR
jgi:hypothetical protein